MKRAAEGQMGRNSELFEPFEPLLRPLSGMNTMCLLTRGEKEILLLGEIHQENFCEEKGFTPLPRILEDYLRAPPKPVDFMLEMGNNPRYYENLTETARQIASEHENRGYAEGEDPKSILTLTRDLVRHFKPTPRARVHWLDANWFNPENESERLMALFGRLFDSYLNGDEKETERLREEINNFLKIPKAESLSYDAKDPKTIQLLFFKVYNALKNSKRLKKCYDSSLFRLQPPTFTQYWSAFRDAYESEKEFVTLDLIYFNIQRFFMDMYTCCRLMKTEAGWYRTIVVYAGDWHIQNYIAILRMMGFTKHELPSPIQMNPKCTGGSRKTRKRLFLKKNQKKSKFKRRARASVSCLRKRPPA